MRNKKLIEVALPLEKINEASAREKSIRHGHPASIHLWWARRPIASTRAVVWASLVDDPSSHPDLFPSEEAQALERKRLFEILCKLIVWENSNDEEILEEAKKEIYRYSNSVLPELLDPFCGGGAIPLEGQRLGLKVHAHDLNPIPIMINKAMLEIPQRFHALQPVNSASRGFLSDVNQKGSSGLAEDVRYYGNWLKEKAFSRLKSMYPKASSNDNGNGLTVIAWIWARTIKCPNPACGYIIPLARTFDLSRNRGGRGKSGTFASIDLSFENGITKYKVIPEKGRWKETISRKGGVCPHCGLPFDLNYVRDEAKHGRMGSDIMAVIAEGNHGRAYLSVDDNQKQAADVSRPSNYPSGKLTGKARVSVPLYGMEETGDLFTNRQLTALNTLSSLVTELRAVVEKDAVKAGMADDHISFENGGHGACAYADAICTYIAFTIDQQANHLSSLCGWHINNEQLMNTFGRQAIPMVWDYAECNLFSNSTGSFSNLLDRVAKGVEHFSFKGIEGEVSQFNAQLDCGLRNVMISTDPPYYDNICYADLSDFFYVWLRNSLKSIYPNVFKTILSPKDDELIASPFRFKDESSAKDFFENGMEAACRQMYVESTDDYPLTIYYAYKGGDSSKKDGNSSGWETMLKSIINSGFEINGTWPMKTEQTAALKTSVNALASSIVLVCRKRKNLASVTTRRNLINELRRELRPALQKLQLSNIAPVDLAQSAIGPGMAVYSRYSKVLEADGSEMSVRSALQIINEELDLYFNEQVGDLDAMSRFCVDLYTQSAFNDIKFGDADVLARAKGTSVDAIASHNVLYAKAGIVHLMEREDLPVKVDKDEKCVWLLTQQLTYAMETGGIEKCASIVYDMLGSNAERAKDLAYRLYTIAEQKKWANEAYAYNSLVVAWPDIQAKAAEMAKEKPEQMQLFDFN